MRGGPTCIARSSGEHILKIKCECIEYRSLELGVIPCSFFLRFFRSHPSYKTESAGEREPDATGWAGTLSANDTSAIACFVLGTIFAVYRLCLRLYGRDDDGRVKDALDGP